MGATFSLWTTQICSNLSIITRGLKETKSLFHERIECTCKKRRTARSSSGQVLSSAASSFPVETEQQELEPEGTGANDLDPDEMAGDDEDGDDDVASTQKSLTANQKSVIQNIHNNC